MICELCSISPESWRTHTATSFLNDRRYLISEEVGQEHEHLGYNFVCKERDPDPGISA